MRSLFIKKMFLVATIMIIILSISTIPTLSNKKVLRTNLNIEDVTNINTNNIYLLNKDNLLVKTEVFIKSKRIDEQVKGVINYLVLDNKNIPSGLNGYLDKNIKILNININNGLLEINFSKELKEDKIVITGIVYSLIDINGIDKIKITKEGKELDGFKGELDKKIGINNRYLYHTRKDLDRVVIYYLDNINDNYYFIPVTKYVDSDKSKIKVIVDELKNNSELISNVSNKLELLDYHEDENVLYLNFNKYLKNDNSMDEITYSVFDSLDVNVISFEVNGKRLTYRKRD